MTDEDDVKKMYQIKLRERLIEKFKSEYGDHVILWGVLDRFLEVFMELHDADSGKGMNGLMLRIALQVKQETEL